MLVFTLVGHAGVSTVHSGYVHGSEFDSRVLKEVLDKLDYSEALKGL